MIKSANVETGGKFASEKVAYPCDRSTDLIGTVLRVS